MWGVLSQHQVIFHKPIWSSTTNSTKELYIYMYAYMYIYVYLYLHISLPHLPRLVCILYIVCHIFKWVLSTYWEGPSCGIIWGLGSGYLLRMHLDVQGLGGLAGHVRGTYTSLDPFRPSKYPQKWVKEELKQYVKNWWKEVRVPKWFSYQLYDPIVSRYLEGLGPSIKRAC